jgi:hypothetical protein
MPTQGDTGTRRGPGGVTADGPAHDPLAARRPRSLPALLRRHGLPALLRRHWLLALLLTAGLVMRILAQIAYRPALVYIDSIKYLFGAYAGDDPPGYLFVLKPFLAVGNLDLVAAGQHLLGLAMAVGLYLLMRRRGVPRWLAALATAPVLLDGYQLQIEQTIMPDTLFEALIVAGLVILLWQPDPSQRMIIAAGLLLGATAPVAQIGEILVVPAVIYLLVAIPGGRAKITKVIALCAAFALPIVAISYRDYLAIHRFALAPHAQSTIYGRMAAAADCQTLRVPSYERSLCPTRRQRALGPDGLDHGSRSPIKALKPGPGIPPAWKIVAGFSHSVERQQPLRVLRAIARDSVKLFAATRTTSPGDTPISRWQFQTFFPVYPPYVTLSGGQVRFAEITPSGSLKVLGRGQSFGGGKPVVSKPIASFLRAYQLGGGYTPGSLFLLTAVAGLAGSLGVLRRRSRTERVTASPAEHAAGPAGTRVTVTACLVTFLAAVGVLLGSDVFEFSWRYQLPALVTLIPAGALGITAVVGCLRTRPGWRPAGRHVPTQSSAQAVAGDHDQAGLKAKDRMPAG